MKYSIRIENHGAYFEMHQRNNGDVGFWIADREKEENDELIYASCATARAFALGILAVLEE